MWHVYVFWAFNMVSVYVCMCVCSAQRELVTTASASLILSPGDVPSFLTNHQGLPSEHYNPRCMSGVHVYHEREHKFSLLQWWKLWGWETLGSQRGLSTRRQKVGLLSNAQLIKHWCVPSPRRSTRCLPPPHLQPSVALRVHPITLKNVFVLSRSTEPVFFSFLVFSFFLFQYGPAL